MTPGTFEYYRPASVAEAVGLLTQHGEAARVLAGGHSLVPMMKLRLAVPEHLIDINGIGEIKGIARSNGEIRIGAATTQADAATSDVLTSSCPIIAETIAVIADHAREVAETCGRKLLLENITTDLRLTSAMPETEFLNKLCEAADCGLLLDVTNLYINSRNHGFDARQWLREIEPGRIVQLHVVGYSSANGRWRDLHAEPIQDDLWQLIGEVMEYAPIQSVILERDWNFPEPSELAGELGRLEAMLARH